MKETSMPNIAGAARVRLITYACYASFLALGFSATILGPSFEALASRFRISLSDAGIFTAGMFLAVSGSVLFWGWLIERVNAGRILVLGALLLGVGWCGVALSQSLPVAILAIVLVGCGFGALEVAPNIVVATLNPDRPGVAVNILNMVFGFGAIAGPQLVNFALANRQPSLSFWVVGVFSLLLVAPFLSINLHVGSQQNAPGQAKAAIPWLLILPYLLLIWFYVGGESGFGSWLFTQMRRVNQSSEALSTISTSVFWAGLTGGRFFASLALRRFSNYQVLLAAILTVCISVATLLIFARVELVVLVAAFFVGFGCGPIFPTAFVMVTALAANARGRVTGIFAAAGTFGGAVLPFFQGRLAGETDGGMIMVLAAGLVMLLLTLFIHKPATN
jgi:MFS transporter, FHS family, glucose/mannose:H+ symporter